MSSAPQQPQVKPLALSMRDAPRVSGLSRSKLYEAIKAGELETVKIGARRLIMLRALEAYLARHKAR